MSESKELTTFDKLVALYKLQVIDSKIDEIRMLRGDAPLKVKDLEDELEGIATMKETLAKEIQVIEEQIAFNKNTIADAKEKLKKYQEQQNKVRNNREYESISKQIEYEELEIQVCEKKIADFTNQLKHKKEQLNNLEKEQKEKLQEYEIAKKELDDIVAETEKDEQELKDLRTTIEDKIEKRLLKAYLRIRKGLRNGLAVVSVVRQACNGCHNKIPMQREIEIESNKKIIVCEFCGRILVDKSIVEIVDKEISQLKLFKEEE